MCDSCLIIINQGWQTLERLPSWVPGKVFSTTSWRVPKFSYHNSKVCEEARKQKQNPRQRLQIKQCLRASSGSPTWVTAPLTWHNPFAVKYIQRAPYNSSPYNHGDIPKQSVLCCMPAATPPTQVMLQIAATAAAILIAFQKTHLPLQHPPVGPESVFPQGGS